MIISSVLMLAPWFAAATEWSFADLSWNDSSFPNDEVVPAINNCLREQDGSGAWNDCVGLFSASCEAEYPDFNLCYAIEAKAWKAIVDSEFRQSLAWYANKPAEATNKPFEGLCDAQKAWISYRNAECRFHFQRTLGSIRRTHAIHCSLTENAERAIELRRLRKTPQGDDVRLIDYPEDVIDSSGMLCETTDLSEAD